MKGKRSVVKMATEAANRKAGARHKRRRIEKLRGKLEAKGYKFPEEPK